MKKIPCEFKWGLLHGLTMTLQLDHFFILTATGAPQADRLSALGFLEGTSNRHPGQGTANRRFFFCNTMLELLYVHDAHEATNGPARCMRFTERASDAEASPFGVVVKSSTGSSAVPFPGWCYQPEYFGADKYFHVGDNADVLAEPLCIYVPFDLPVSTRQPQPADPFGRLSELRIHTPVERPSVALEAITQIEGVSMHYAKPHLMELIFNAEKSDCCQDMRPHLPLLIRW